MDPPSNNDGLNALGGELDTVSEGSARLNDRDYDAISRLLTRHSITGSSRDNEDANDNNDDKTDNENTEWGTTSPKYSCGHVVPFQCFGDECFTLHECRACSWRKVLEVMRETRRGQARRHEIISAQLEDIKYIRRVLGLIEFAVDPNLIAGTVWTLWDGFSNPLLFAFNLRLEYKRWELLKQIRRNKQGAAKTIADFVEAWVDRFGKTTQVEMDGLDESLREYAAENEVENEAEREEQSE